MVDTWEDYGSVASASTLLEQNSRWIDTTEIEEATTVVFGRRHPAIVCVVIVELVLYMTPFISPLLCRVIVYAWEET